MAALLRNDDPARSGIADYADRVLLLWTSAELAFCSMLAVWYAVAK